MIREIKDGVLYFDGCNTAELAKRYGTPLYVISRTDIEERFEELRRDFLSEYRNTRAAYACKAFCTKAMLKLCEAEGLCIDVVSGGELYTAISVGFPAERIEFNGNNKLASEIEMAVDYGIGRIIVDGLRELELIERICAEKGRRMKILYRITPGVKADTHDYIITGKKDSKFGIPLDDDIIYPEIKKAIDSPHVEFLGFHFHVGSQLFDNSPYLQAVDTVMDNVRAVKEKFGYEIRELNLGGGFGAAYTDEERKPLRYFIAPMMEKIKNACDEMDMPMPVVVIEPGRSIIAEAGMTLYEIGSIKDIPGVRKYVSVDGGMTDNIRPALYQSLYEGTVANKADFPKDDKVTVCGKCCESGDILIRDCMITSEASAGDVFAIFSTGAYGYSMASNYNRNPIPAVVMVKEGNSEIIVNRQSYDDMISRDVIPQSLIENTEV